MARPLPAYAGDAPYVFVCYSHEDKKTVYPEIAWLQQQGINVWYDEGISPGHEWSEDLGRAIDGASHVLFFVTPASISSRHCRNEIHYAQSHERPILAVHLEDTALPPGLELALGASQAVLAHELPRSAARAKVQDALRQATATSPSPNIGAAAARTRFSRLGKWSGSVALLTALIAGSAYWYNINTTSAVGESSQPKLEVSENSIAVLPFTDMSEDQDQGYLADGMAVEIIDALAQIPDLHVPARTSSFYFKGTPTTIPDIARKLRVANVLEGSIRLADSRLRVTTQLVRADTGFRVWSKRYDRNFDDVFAVQDDIAYAVVDALHMQFMGAPLDRRGGSSRSTAAYQLYLKARSAIYENSEASLNAAEQYLKEAIDLDPEYGQAWAELALTILVKADNGFLPRIKAYERVRELANHALQLNPEIAEAHGALQYVHTVLDMDWEAAEDAGRRALAIDPKNTTALLFDGILSKVLTRWDEAQQSFQAALARDPLNAYARWNLGTTYYNAGQFTDAERVHRNLIDVAPNFAWTRGDLTKTLLAQNRTEEALAVIQEDAPENRILFLPMALHGVGREVEADEALESLIAQWGDPPAYFIALNYAYRGEPEPALDWLERAYQMREPDFVMGALSEHFLDSLSDHPRYQALLRRMNLEPRPQ